MPESLSWSKLGIRKCRIELGFADLDEVDAGFMIKRDILLKGLRPRRVLADAEGKRVHWA